MYWFRLKDNVIIMEAFMIKHSFCNVKYRNTIYKDIASLFLCVGSRPNFGCFLTGSPPSLSNPHNFVFNKTITEMNYGLKK